MTDIDKKYLELGGPKSLLGLPAGKETPTADKLGTFRNFQNGAIYSKASTGTHEVTGNIYKHWTALGLERGELGYPISGVNVFADGEQTLQFERGTIRWTGDKGAVALFDKKPKKANDPGVEFIQSGFDPGNKPTEQDLTSLTAPLNSVIAWKDLAQIATTAGTIQGGKKLGMSPTVAASIVAEAERLEAEAKTPVQQFLSPSQLRAVYRGKPHLAASLAPEKLRVTTDTEPLRLEDLNDIWPQPRRDDVSGSTTSAGRQGRAAETGVTTRQDAFTLLDPSALRNATTFGVMERDFVIPKVALALSGGGARGDFQVGALRFIYDRLLGWETLGIRARPDIIAGTSVGAVNGSKLAEGNDDSLDQLEAIWGELSRNDHMYRAELNLQQLLDPLTALAKDMVLWSIGNLLALTGPAIFVGLAMAMRTAGELIMDLLERLRETRAIYNLNPIAERTRQYSPFWSLTGPGLRGTATAVGRDREGRVVIAVRGYDDGCWVSVSTSLSNPRRPTFTRWIRLATRIDSDPELMLDASGNIFGIVARLPTDGRYHAIFLDRDSSRRDGWSSSWEPMGFPERIHFEARGTGGPLLRFTSSPRAILGVGPSAGYRWIFARGTDHNAYSRVFVPFIGSPGGRWHPFQIMAGPVPIGSQITCGISSAGFKFAFARRTTNRVIVCPAAPAILRWERWSDFAGETRGDVTPANYSDGRVVIFVVGMDYAVWCRAQTDPAVNSWTDWQRLDGILTSNVAAARDANEVLTIFARGADKAIWYNRASSPAGFTASDTNWVSLGTPSGIEFNTDPVVHRLPNSMLAVFAVGNDKKLYLNIQTSTGDSVTYAGWHKIGGNLWTGIELRLATVSVESGELRHVDESGRFCESLEIPPGVPDAIIASASIPAIFPAVPMNGQAWVDGGVRSVVPIQAAISAGAQLVYAIACSPNTLVDPENQPPRSFIGGLQNAVRDAFDTDDFWSFPETLASWSEASIPEIGLRAIDMLPHSILQMELAPYQPWPVPVIVIQPSFGVHDPLTIDSALIRISEAYGWMRAYEATLPWDPVPAMRSSDAITLKRRQIWLSEGDFLRSLQEAACHGYITTEPQERGLDEGFTLADDLRSTIARREFTAASCISRLRAIRAAKHALDALVRERRAQGFELPPGADDWWRGWERARITTTCSPQGYESRGGPWDSWTITAHGGRSFSIEEEAI